MCEERSLATSLTKVQLQGTGYIWYNEILFAYGGPMGLVLRPVRSLRPVALHGIGGRASLLFPLVHWANARCCVAAAVRRTACWGPYILFTILVTLVNIRWPSGVYLYRGMLWRAATRPSAVYGGVP